MDKNILEEFEQNILEDILKIVSEGEILEFTKIFIEVYKEHHMVENLDDFMPSYLYYIAKKEIDNFQNLYNIELFLNKNFCTENESLNDYRNFFQIDGYPFFTFIFRHRLINTGILGILYFDKEKKCLNVSFLEREDGFDFLVNIKNDIELIYSDKNQLLNALKKFLCSKSIKKTLRNELIDDFDEFLSIVLNLNDEYKDIIEPFGKKFLDKLNKLELKD